MAAGVYGFQDSFVNNLVLTSLQLSIQSDKFPGAITLFRISMGKNKL
jgi:hypothetical protein